MSRILDEMMVWFRDVIMSWRVSRYPQVQAKYSEGLQDNPGKNYLPVMLMRLFACVKSRGLLNGWIFHEKTKFVGEK